MENSDTIEIGALTPEQRRKAMPRNANQTEIINVEADDQLHEDNIKKIFILLGFTNFILFLPLFTEGIILFYSDNELSCLWIIISLIIFEGLCMGEVIVLPIAYSQLRKNKKYFLEIGFFSLTRIFAYIGFSLFNVGLIESSSLSSFVFPDLLGYLIYSCKYQMGKMKVLNFIYTVCLLFISRFVASQAFLTLLFAFSFYILSIFIVVIVFSSYIVALMFALKLYFWAPAMLNHFYPELANNFWKNYLKQLIICFVCFWFVAGYSCLIIGLFMGIYGGILKDKRDPCPPLIFGAWIIKQISLCILCFLAVSLLQMRNEISKFFESLKAKEIVIHKFAQSIQLGFVQKGVNYFIKSDEKTEAFLNNDIYPMNLGKPPECQICMTNFCDTLFDPCGHYIVCQVCLNQYFKKSLNCMVCKRIIEKVHLIYFDSESKTYKAEGVYDIKK